MTAEALQALHVLRAPVLGILCTCYAEEGAVIGPVGPTRIEVQPYRDAFRLVFTFECLSESVRPITVTEAVVQIADGTRRHSLRVVLDTDETLVVTYTVNIDQWNDEVH